MKRDEIVRDDFPAVRKGWDQEAVRAHLSAVAAAYPDQAVRTPSTPAADLTSDRVGGVIAAAESAAAEILDGAQSEADRILAAARSEAEVIRAAARTESEQAVSAAGREASTRAEQAQAAVEGLISQADKLRTQVGALGRDLAANVPGIGSASPPADEETPDGQAKAEPEPERAPEPPAPAPKRAAKPPSPPAPVADGAPSDDDLIAQLRGGKAPTAATDPPEPAVSSSENGAPRLVAMNMALEGASREQITKRIAAEFGSVDDIDQMLDDVLRRADR